MYLKENLLYLLKQLLLWLYTWLNQVIISLNKNPLSCANQKHADHNFSKQLPETYTNKQTTSGLINQSCSDKQAMLC